jgi:hypothetical protein
MSGPTNPGISTPVIYALAPSAAGSVVIGGNFTFYNAAPATRIARVNADTADLEPFTRGSGFNRSVYALERTSSEKYMFVGGFSNYDNVPRNGIARLNSDGTLDDSFVPTPVLTGSVWCLALQGSKTFVGGFMTGPSNKVARFSSTGTLESGFNPGSGVTTSPPNAFAASGSGNVNALALEPSGKLLIGGFFNQYNGVPRHHIARLTGPPLQARAALSRKTHGAAGPFDIELPLSGVAGIESRSTSGNHQVIIQFAVPVTFNNASVTSGTGNVASTSTSGDGREVTVNLAGVSNAQKIRITLAGVSDGSNTIDVPVWMSLLAGDVAVNGSVNVSDIGQTKSQAGRAITLFNFRADVNANGAINSSDISLVKSQSGTALP